MTGTRLTQTPPGRPAAEQPPSPPSLPASLQSRVQSALTVEMAGASYRVSLNPHWRAPALTATEVSLVQDALAEHQAYLAPAEPKALLARITVLLSHFYVAELPPAISQAIATDWFEALCEFPAWAVNRAAAAWLREESGKPSIADIRRLCIGYVEREQRHATVLNRMLLAQHELRFGVAT